MDTLPTYDALVADGWEWITNSPADDVEFLLIQMRRYSDHGYRMGEPHDDTHKVSSIQLISEGLVGVYRNSGRRTKKVDMTPPSFPSFLSAPKPKPAPPMPRHKGAFDKPPVPTFALSL